MARSRIAQKPLYVNQGVDKQSGIPHFKEMAGAYGLDDTSSTHMAAFLTMTMMAILTYTWW